MNEKFNVSDWLQTNTANFNLQAPSTRGSVPARTDFEPYFSNNTELVISRIEAAHCDITATYDDWLKIGFALSNEFGEAGRSFFHRISSISPKYSLADCDKKFDECLKTNDKKTHIATFFYLAQQAGIDVTSSEPSARITSTENQRPIKEMPKMSEPAEANSSLFNTPQLPVEVYTKLPVILRESCELFENGIERDVFLIASLAVISGCLPNIAGTYFEENYTAHLYAFVTAPAGSGKGKMKWAKYFGETIHNEMLEQSYRERDAYESELERYETLTKPQKQDTVRPSEPKKRMLYIPANSSSSAFIQTLYDNNFNGVIFETEADTLADTFKQEWGNFSYVLRKAFHHENTSMSRRKDNESIDIKDPHLAMVLSGTPKQVNNIMPDVENGLFSRFMYYAFTDNSEFKNPFISYKQINYTNFFNQKGKVIFELYQTLLKLTTPLRFKLSDEQGLRFTEHFRAMLTKNKMLLGNDLDANIKRLGIITFRIAMILTALRLLDTEKVTRRITEKVTTANQCYEDQDLSTLNENSHLLSRLSSLICSDQDYNTAITIATTLEKHAIAVYQNMPNNGLKGIHLAFYEALPEKFDRQCYLKVADKLGIIPKTADKYISLFKTKLLDHEHNEYSKK